MCGNRSTLIKSMSSGAGAGAMFMKRKAPEPELYHFYDGSAALFFSKQKRRINGSSPSLPVATLTLVTDHDMKIGLLVSLACLGHIYCLSWEVLILQMYKCSQFQGAF